MKYKKDPNAVLDYLVDFAAKTNGRGIEDYLQNGEFIVSKTIISSAPAELIINSSSLTDMYTSVTIWLSGGTVGKIYTVTCRIVTNMGRTDDRSFQIQVVEK